MITFSPSGKATGTSENSMATPSERLATCRFYAELNDFLPPGDRQRPIERRVDAPGAVKDFIEAFGVPHTEVNLVLVNGEPAGFAHPVRPGDRVGVYPVFRRLDLAPSTRLRAVRPAEVRFVLDVHLGRLAGYLRLAGFDTAYRHHCEDGTLASIAQTESRILLTRDRELLKRRIVEWGYWVRETRPHRQLAEIVRRFDLGPLLRPFTRCGRCNGLLDPVAKQEIAGRLLPETRQAHREFHRCRDCGQLYWRGSHVAAIERLLASATNRKPVGTSDSSGRLAVAQAADSPTAAAGRSGRYQSRKDSDKAPDIVPGNWRSPAPSSRAGEARFGKTRRNPACTQSTGNNLRWPCKKPEPPRLPAQHRPVGGIRLK